MAIRKPIDIEKLISKGAAVKEDNRSEKAVSSINLRIPTEMLNRIDEEVNKSNIRIPRTTWILQSLEKRLKEL